MLGTWIDYSAGQVSGASMVAAGITGAVRYVGVGGAGKRLTRAEYIDHCAHGRQTIAVVERSTTDADGGAAAGTANALAARTDLEAITAGLDPIRIVFMANDQSTSTAAEVAYVRAAAAAWGDEYVVGPYGFGDFLLACSAAGVAPIAWQAGPAPSRTGTGALATFWQRQGGAVKPADGPTAPVTHTVDGVACDLNNQLKELPDMGDLQSNDPNLMQLVARVQAAVAGKPTSDWNLAPIKAEPNALGKAVGTTIPAIAAEVATVSAKVDALTTALTDLVAVVAHLQPGTPPSGSYPATVIFGQQAATEQESQS